MIFLKAVHQDTITFQQMTLESTMFTVTLAHDIAAVVLREGG